MVSIYEWLEVLNTILDTFSSFPRFLFGPISSWLPDRIAQIPYGDALAALVRAFLKASGFGDFSLVAVMFGSGLLIFLIYTLVTWVLNVVT